MAEGIVLAGGYSSRIKTNKMILDLDGMPLIKHTVDKMRKFTTKVYVITGFYHQDIENLFQGDLDVKIIRNINFDQGMFSSVQTGVAEVKTDFLIIPGDYPIVSDSTYESLISASGQIRVPVYANRRGHPILIESGLRTALLAEPADSNLKIFRNRYEVNYVLTDDEGIICDVDTMKDFFYIQNKVKGENGNENQ